MRAAFTFLLVAVMGTAVADGQQSQRVYYISFPADYLALRPVKVRAKDRLDAIMQLSLTAWTEKEWQDSQKLMATAPQKWIPVTLAENYYQSQLKAMEGCKTKPTGMPDVVQIISCQEPAPFDVPPKEWDGPEEVAQNTCNLSSGSCTGVYIPVKVHHVTCEDKTRFLLRSEDGKPHCLALGAKP